MPRSAARSSEHNYESVHPPHSVTNWKAAWLLEATTLRVDACLFTPRLKPSSATYFRETHQLGCNFSLHATAFQIWATIGVFLPQEMKLGRRVHWRFDFETYNSVSYELQACHGFSQNESMVRMSTRCCFQYWPQSTELDRISFGIRNQLWIPGKQPIRLSEYGTSMEIENSSRVANKIAHEFSPGPWRTILLLYPASLVEQQLGMNHHYSVPRFFCILGIPGMLLSDNKEAAMSAEDRFGSRAEDSPRYFTYRQRYPIRKASLLLLVNCLIW